MRKNKKAKLHTQMKYVVWGCQTTLFAISAFRAFIGDYNTALILGSVMILLLPLFFIIEKKYYTLASNIFTLIVLALATSYMWTYEGARDEVSYILPAIVAFSLITGTKAVSIFVIGFAFTNIILLGYLTDIGERTQTVSTNNLASSILIVILMSFSIFIFWKLLTHLKSALKKVEQSLNTQNAILDNLGDALIITDLKGRIMQCSNSAERMFRCKEDELRGKSIFKLVPKLASYYSHTNPYQTDLASITSHHAYKATTLTGEQFDIRLALTQTELDDQLSYIALISDISEEMAFQEQLKKATQEAAFANQAKSDFLANMSHEIRTPMNGVLASLQLLKQEELSAPVEDIIDTAVLSSSHLVSIINDILDFSKIEAGKLNLEQVPFKIKPLCESVIADLAFAAKTSNNQITLNVSPNFKDGFSGDPVRIKQILLNLVSNSVKFTEAGVITINIAHSPEDHLTITVTDTGIGMSAGQISSLFKRFEQADSSTTRKYGGTGLGMAITKHLINMMSGQIDVTSQINQGTTFSVSLPLPSQAIATKYNTVVEPVKTLDLSNVTVLLAEDNKINQKVFEKILTSTKANLTIANDGKEAVTCALANPPDIIFMDIQMPNMDGIEACKLIKDVHSNIPIIALTANVMADDIQQYLDVGFDTHIAKPIDIDSFYSVVQKTLNIE